MLIKTCKGYELEKEKSNTSEDFFNRSEVTYIEDGEEKTLHVLYVRFFDEHFSTYTPFKHDPVFTVDNRPVHFKDLVALACLIKFPGYRNRKRVYISSEREFENHFQGINLEKFEEIFISLNENNGYSLQSPLEFVR
ncbi:hypothetical protein [Peribacillus alkalitolerans]|uniref:hypothetical protein n=1 Tax=Peribacillus alkalitolerans TaxID=1550385 RepID=UPI0013D5CD2F|nr:hypothetical protein [Peribacillus alkalitolerans]